MHVILPSYQQTSQPGDTPLYWTNLKEDQTTLYYESVFSQHCITHEDLFFPYETDNSYKSQPSHSSTLHSTDYYTSFLVYQQCAKHINTSHLPYQSIPQDHQNNDIKQRCMRQGATFLFTISFLRLCYFPRYLDIPTLIKQFTRLADQSSLLQCFIFTAGSERPSGPRERRLACRQASAWGTVPDQIG